MSQKFYSDIEARAGLRDSSGALGTSGQILSSTGSNVSWINQSTAANDVQNRVKAGVAINKGQAVYVTGADGTNIIVGLASNASEATSSKTLGLLNATVAINGMADVVQIGRLSGLNTLGATAGDPVWLGTGGNLIYGLIGKPYAPANLVFIGIVTRVNVSNGEIFVNVQNGFELNEIHDVDLKTNVPINGDVLGFNGTLWVNKTIAGWLGYTPANASGTTNYVSKFTGTTTLGNSQIFDNGTNVGIGTTTPGAKLDVSSGNINLSNSFNLTARNNANTFNIALIGRSSTDRVIIDADGYGTNIGSGGTVLINPSGGNVGIGTTSPTAPLTFANVTGNKIDFYYDTTGIGDRYGIQIQSSELRIHAGAGGDSTGGITFGKQSTSTFTEAMRITNAGNVGIGTSAPAYKTTIYGNSTDTDVLCVSNNQINADLVQHFVGISLQDQYSNGGGNVSAIRSYSNLYAQWGSTLTFSTTGTAGNGIYERMRITNTGNVGIGNTNPGAKLDVSGDIFCRPGAGIYSNVYSPYTGNMTIELGGNNLIVSNGNVGIGTTSPQYTLDVNGTSRSTTFRVDDATNSTGLLIYSGAPSGNGAIARFLKADSTKQVYQTFENDSLYLGIAANQTSVADIGTKSGVNMVFSTAYSERMRIDTSGNVGIGTSSPGHKLQVSGTAGTSWSTLLQSNSKSAVYSAHADGYGMAIETSQNTSAIYTFKVAGGDGTNIGTNEYFRITGTGNVGIGTSSPSEKLVVGNLGGGVKRIYVPGTYNFDGSYLSNYDGNGGGKLELVAHTGVSNSASWRIANNNDTYGQSLTFSYAPNTTSYSALSYSAPAMLIANTGNVGIGTTSPGEKLSVKSADAAIKLEGSTNSYLFQIVDSNNRLRIFDNTNNVERITLTSGGNVGIGTSSPQNKLQIGTMLGYSTNAFAIGNGSIDFAIYQDTSLTQLYTSGGFLFATNSNERMRITSAGNVGIGTTTPQSALSIGTNHGTLVSIGNASWGSTAVLKTSWDGSDYTQLLVAGGSSNSAAITLRASGNVGIGTSSPGAKLDVNGDALINNVTIGRGPGNISTNTALGTGALDSTTTANYNIAVGWGANTNNNANGLTAIGVDLNVGPDTGNLGQDCLAIAQFNSNADTAQVPHIYAPKPISIGGGATNIITFDLLHYAGAIVEYLIRYDDGGDYAVGTVYMGWKSSGSGNMKDVRQIEWNNMSGFVFSLGGSGQTLVLTNTSGGNAWIRITVRGMMTN